MIIPFLTFLVGGGIGFAAGHATSNKEAKAELEELRRRLQIAQGNGTPIPALLPGDEYREPDRTAVINLPIDAEDFKQLHEAMCECLRALKSDKAEGEKVTDAELRDCLLEAIYPDFTWPPVPGDPSAAHLMWLVADHEARKTLADPSACPPVMLGGIDAQSTDPDPVTPEPTPMTFQGGGS
jgi:hypothetical protein